MTNDQLRTGAALVRALVEGDDTARLPLSDFVEEFGLPASENVIGYAIRVLRNGLSTYQFSRSYDGRIFTYLNGALIGTWPLWAWEGEYAPFVEARREG